MKNIAFTAKIDGEQLLRLKRASASTGIPQSTLVRKGIDMVLRQMEEDGLTVSFKAAVDRVMRRNDNVFRTLAKYDSGAGEAAGETSGRQELAIAREKAAKKYAGRQKNAGRRG